MTGDRGDQRRKLYENLSRVPGIAHMNKIKLTVDYSIYSLNTTTRKLLHANSCARLICLAAIHGLSLQQQQLGPILEHIVLYKKQYFYEFYQS